MFQTQDILTKPSEQIPGTNENISGDLIIHSGETITSPTGMQYKFLSLIGHGQFGQVFSVCEVNTRSPYAIKVSKNNQCFIRQAKAEVDLLSRIKSGTTEEEKEHISQMYEYFSYKNHVMIVLELLSYDLYSVIVQNNYRGFRINFVQSVLRECLQDLVILERLGIVHSDIKPENIVLESKTNPSVKLIDFGSARLITQAPSMYIQSRYYRAPEVIVGLNHDFKIDIWSLACVAVELLIALPLFPGQSEFHQMMLIQKMLGPFPPVITKQGQRSAEFFNPDGTMRTEAEYCASKGTPPVSNSFKHYLQCNKLDEIIFTMMAYIGRTEEEKHAERARREKLIDLLYKMFIYDPDKRISAADALQHPFIVSDL